MAKRYIGDAVVTIKYHDATSTRQDDYRGTVSAGGYSWRFDGLRAAPAGFGPGIGYDSPEAYDEMAKSAVSFGGYYTTHNRGDDVPDWAPLPEVADAINDATSWAMRDDGSYEVRRSRTGPAHANPPALTPAQSRRRVAELRARGCEVRRVKLPSGDTAVVKDCPDEKGFINALREVLGKEPLRANPDGDSAPAWFALGALAVAGGLIWYVSRPGEAKATALPPATASACPTAAQVKAFAYSKSLTWFPTSVPVATWVLHAPKTGTQWTPDARIYSEVDCAFYKWQSYDGAPSAWVKDAALTAELLASAKKSTTAGLGHPVSMFLP